MTAVPQRKAAARAINILEKQTAGPGFVALCLSTHLADRVDSLQPSKRSSGVQYVTYSEDSHQMHRLSLTQDARRGKSSKRCVSVQEQPVWHRLGGACQSRSGPA